MLTAAVRHRRTERLRQFVLGAGAAAGILLAAAGALAPTAEDFAGSVIARVNGKAITSHDLVLALGRLADDGRVSPPPTGRQEALDFLIDQELLIQRGVEIGLLESDRTVRKVIAMAMIDTVVAGVLKTEPTEEELRAFYASHQSVFTVPARVHVQHIVCGGDGDLTRAQAQAEWASTAIAQGMSFAEARERYGDQDSAPVPDAPVPLQVLYRHLGPGLTHAALAMPVGDISRPLPSPSGYHLLRMVELQPEHVQPYEAVRQAVKAEYFRRRRDEALQHYLERLREGAIIVLSPKAPVGKQERGDLHG
jgi:parvulin-like peptidyl-prolyl isomerase